MLAVLSDEAAFNATLDADPGDHLARRAYADWLYERGDERAEGYQVLAELGRVPEVGVIVLNGPLAGRWEFNRLDTWLKHMAHPDCGPLLATGRRYVQRAHVLPASWAFAIQRPSPKAVYEWWPTRREAEDAAALAWAKLTAAERAAILGATNGQTA